MCFICALGSKARNLLQALPPPEDTPRLGDVQHPVSRGNSFIQMLSAQAGQPKPVVQDHVLRIFKNLRLHFLLSNLRR